MPKKILIVDDELDIRMVCRAVLKQAGYEVVTAGDGQDAIKLIEDSAARGNGLYNLIVTDGNMPGIEGTALLKYVKENYSNLPVIVMSAQENYLDSAKRLGADGVLDKPFENKGLVAVVKRCLKEEHQQAII